MNCHDSRDSFSAYLDDALAPEERTALEAHLVGCGECRLELDRFRQTVSLLHRVERPRAPVGFAGWVLAATQPTPWYRRWLQRAFFPLPVKLPIEAAALVLLSIGAVYLVQRTPELQHAAREQAPQVTAKPEAPAYTPPSSSAEGAREKGAEPARQLERESDTQRRDGKIAGAKAPLPATGRVAPPAESTPAPSVRAEAKKQRALDNVAAPRSADVRAPAAPAPLPEQERRDAVTEGARSAPAPSPGATAKSATVTAIVAGRLAVKDREAGEQALSELLDRLKATEVSRRRDAGGVVVEVLVSKEAYPEFTQGLKRIGSWTLEAEPSELPAQVPMRLRLLE